MDSSSLFTWVVLPLLIFLARIIDVSLGTMRFVFISKGFRLLAAVTGFFEVSIWLLAIKQVIANVDNIPGFLAYGLGFAMGNYVGLWLEEKLSLGKVLFRLVLQCDTASFTRFMHSRGYGYTIVEGEGTRDKVKILFSILQRRDLRLVLSQVIKTNPKAFYTIENVRAVARGVFPVPQKHPLAHLFAKQRKSK